MPARIPENRIRSTRSAENLPECGITHEQRTSSFTTVPNYDNDDEAWSVDDIVELQVEVRPGGMGGDARRVRPVLALRGAAGIRRSSGAGREGPPRWRCHPSSCLG